MSSFTHVRRGWFITRYFVTTVKLYSVLLFNFQNLELETPSGLWSIWVLRLRIRVTVIPKIIIFLRFRGWQIHIGTCRLFNRSGNTPFVLSSVWISNRTFNILMWITHRQWFIMLNTHMADDISLQKPAHYCRRILLSYMALQLTGWIW